MGVDELYLLLLLYLLYLSDCFFGIHAPALVLYASFRGSQWKAKSTEGAMFLARRYWVLRPLLPPVASSFMLPLSRCSFGAEGFSSISPLSDVPWIEEEIFYIPYDAVKTLNVEGSLFKVNGQTWFRGIPKELEALKLRVQKIVAGPNPAEAVKQLIRADFKSGLKAKKHLTDLEEASISLSWVCSIYALYLLVFLPAILIFRSATALSSWWISTVFIMLHFLCAFFFFRVHSRLLPDKKATRWESLVKMSLCPPLMIRAGDELNDAVGIPGNSLAIAISALDPPEWRPLIQKIWRRLLYVPVYPIPPEHAAAIREFVSTYRSVLEATLGKLGIKPRDLEIDVEKIPVGCRCCPRCGVVYNRSVRLCRDCGGISLLPEKDET